MATTVPKTVTTIWRKKIKYLIFGILLLFGAFMIVRGFTLLNPSNYTSIGGYYLHIGVGMIILVLAVGGGLACIKESLKPDKKNEEN